MILSSGNIYLLAWALVIISFSLAVAHLFIISYTSAILAVILGVASEIMSRRESS